jgi:hypothetical protein
MAGTPELEDEQAVDLETDFADDGAGSGAQRG